LKRLPSLTSLLCLSTPAWLAAAWTLSCSSTAPDGVGNTSGSGGNAGHATGGAGGSSGSPTASGGGAGAASGSAGATTGGQGGSGVGAAGAGAGAGQGGATANGGSGVGGAAPGAGQAGSAGAGMTAAGGMPAVGGAGASAGMAGSAGAPLDGSLGSGMMTGMGRSSEQYETTEVGRNGLPYILITNGWGPGFDSHTVAWNGTSFIVETMSGSRGSGGQPASYPTVFCGRYSVMQVPDCRLPRAIDQIQTLKTGWRWSANGNTGAYNAAYDIWLGTETGFGMYLMVWLRDPPGEQPAGAQNPEHLGVTVTNVPGVWDIWNGTVNSRPIINWVRREGTDSPEIEFDVMDFIRDAQTRGLTITGTQVNAVAVGFEIWQGPVTNLESVDFYVDVK
jgi:hypothetical protein